MSAVVSCACMCWLYAFVVVGGAVYQRMCCMYVCVEWEVLCVCVSGGRGTVYVQACVWWEGCMCVMPDLHVGWYRVLCVYVCVCVRPQWGVLHVRL